MSNEEEKVENKVEEAPATPAETAPEAPAETAPEAPEVTDESGSGTDTPSSEEAPAATE